MLFFCSFVIVAFFFFSIFFLCNDGLWVVVGKYNVYIFNTLFYKQFVIFSGDFFSFLTLDVKWRKQVTIVKKRNEKKKELEKKRNEMKWKKASDRWTNEPL